MAKKVVIDAGHGGSDSGAIGNGIIEKNLTLEGKYMIYAHCTKKSFRFCA